MTSLLLEQSTKLHQVFHQLTYLHLYRYAGFVLHSELGRECVYAKITANKFEAEKAKEISELKSIRDSINALITELEDAKKEV